MILPSSDAGNPDGWRTMSGRFLSLVHTHARRRESLRVRSFNPESYATKYSMSDSFEFVPYREKWGSAAWIEIDRGLIASQFISGTCRN